MPFAEEKIAGLVETNLISSYLRSAQNSAVSFQYTGALVRSSLNAG
jgi:hypothetical protein